MDSKQNPSEQLIQQIVRTQMKIYNSAIYIFFVFAGVLLSSALLNFLPIEVGVFGLVMGSGSGLIFLWERNRCRKRNRDILS